MPWERISLVCFFSSYLVAWLLELTQLSHASRLNRWAAIVFSAGGLIAQTAYLIVRSRRHDLPPLVGSVHDWLLVLAWLAVLLCLGLQLWNRQSAIGIFCLPVVLVLVGGWAVAGVGRSGVVRARGKAGKPPLRRRSGRGRRQPRWLGGT